MAAAAGSNDGLLTASPALRQGDAVSVVAPASSPTAEAFRDAIAGLKSRGFRPRTYRDVCSPDGFLSGTDAERAAEFNQALADPETRMILAARGGYGVTRLLDRLDYQQLRLRPKIVCGYSDITALHAAVHRECRLVTFHGPNLVDGLGSLDQRTADEYMATSALLGGETTVGDALAARFDDYRTLRGGVAEGRLVGGNLSVLTALLGTPWQPDFEGAILVLEDVGEAPHRLDRMLTQLRSVGATDGLRGVVFGYFTDSEPAGGVDAARVLADFAAELTVPVLAGAPFGHEHPNLPLPLGARVRLDADAGVVELAQAVVRL